MINIVVTTCGEEQTCDLVSFLAHTINENFKIWVLRDSTKSEECYDHIVNNIFDNVKHVKYPMDGNFSKFRNSVHDYFDYGDWVLQLDADEMISLDFIKVMPALINQNPDVELYYLPRNNFVNGITEEYVDQMGWNIDDEGRINYPDWQGRLYKYKKNVEWQGRVHERVTGAKNYAKIKEPWAHIEHIKDFGRQKKQNEYYETLEG